MKSQKTIDTSSIILNDKTSARLFLAADFLHFLNNQNLKVRLHLNSQRSAYGNFFQFFPNIQINEKFVPLKNNGDELQIDFIEEIADINSSHLNYPLVKEKFAADFSREMQKHPFNIIPFSNEQSCGLRTADAESAEDLLFRHIGENDLAGRRILISAGPTAEDIDPVRFITNRSSGKMGTSLARAAFRRGADIKLVLGPATLKIPDCLQSVRVRSAKEMADAVISAFKNTDIYIGCAAVADYTPQSAAKEKIKKSEENLVLTLERTTDILKALGKIRNKQVLAGFSVETNAEMENSERKLRSKNLDLIVINNPKKKGAAFGADTNLVTILDKKGRSKSYPLMSKIEVSNKILDWIKEIQ